MIFSLLATSAINLNLRLDVLVSLLSREFGKNVTSWCRLDLNPIMNTSAFDIIHVSTVCGLTS